MKDIFHVSVRTNSTDALLQFVYFLVPLITCSKVEAGNFTTHAYNVLLNIGKSVLKMMKTLWKNSLTNAKDVGIIHVNFVVIAVTVFEEKNWQHYFFTTPCIS
jgi:hypothetical protein